MAEAGVEGEGCGLTVNELELAILEKLRDVFARPIVEMIGVADDHAGKFTKITRFPFHGRSISGSRCCLKEKRGGRGRGSAIYNGGRSVSRGEVLKQRSARKLTRKMDRHEVNS